MLPYETDLKDLAGIRARAEAHGFCLVRGAFAIDEIERLKGGMAAEHERYQSQIPDVLSCPSLRWLLFDRRILSIARLLLGEQLVYYGETAVNYEATVGKLALSPYNTLHYDGMGTPTDLTHRWSSPTNALYRAYRFGLYFQDYQNFSGGLKVGIGTHRGDPLEYIANDGLTENQQILPLRDGRALKMPATRMPLHNVPARPGDLVVWNLRTMHAAGACVLNDAPGIALHPNMEIKLKKQAPELFGPIPGPRLSLFFDYAAPAEEADLYIKSRSQSLFDERVAFFANATTDGAEETRLAEESGVALRSDYLLVSLAVIYLKTGPQARNPIARRLIRLAERHHEFSPHFPLFDRGRFDEARAIGEDAALQVLLDGICLHAPYAEYVRDFPEDVGAPT